jgi:hypothetical protein
LTKGRTDVDVEKRLFEDARSFAKEVTALDEAGFIYRTLAVLGIPADTSGRTSGNENGCPDDRPQPAAAPPGAPASIPFVKCTTDERPRR